MATLGPLLENLLNGRIGARDVDAIIHSAISQARSYLRWLIWQRNYTVLPLGLTIDDLACDTVAELVSDLDGEQLARLRRALRDMREEEEAVSLECAFKAVVLRTVRFNLARVFMDMQPVRARLLRSLRRAAQTRQLLRRIDSVSGYWYATVDGDAMLELPAAPVELLRSLLRGPVLSVQPAPTVALTLLQRLREFPDLRQAVAEEDVLELTLELLQADQEAATPDAQDDALSPDLSLLESTALEALQAMRPWLYASYVDKGKIDDHEAAAMLAAAEGYIRGLARNEDSTHYACLRRTLPGLTHPEYRSRYRNTYEYMLRGVFATARERLQLSEDAVDRIPHIRDTAPQ